MLTITICTCGERLSRVVDVILPTRTDVEYVVSWQPYGAKMEIPTALQRHDIKVVFCNETGLSANRNCALASVRTPYATISDDDVRFNNEDIDKLFSLIANNPDTDIFCLKCRIVNGADMKNYPNSAYTYPLQPSGAYISSCEIVIKMSERIPPFDINYGLKSQHLSCGEEEIFLIDAHKRGCNVKYYPQYLGSLLSDETTGKKFLLDSGVQRAKGAVLYRRYGLIGAMLRIVKTTCLAQRKLSIALFRNMLMGVYYGRKFNLQSHHSGS